MGLSPKKPCKKPGCSELTTTGFCIKHSALKRGYDQERESSSKRGYGHHWRIERAAFLRENPLCAQCYKEERVRESTVVDHIKPHKGDMKLFWDRQNWQALCKFCHDAKTAREDGGFGRKVKFISLNN
ncbi:HNH endonuclease [Paenibacillus sp. FSL H8-0457]|uniref:HNH endonuclease n=1 Tax=unclassified Paenibacillus TaxID=185978 RepID=UPI0003E2826F|nr:HNH endonuclease [Paenibacillus sp. FSL H8-457]ETT58194.1 HNH endonuclease [Paenibacillus sp. FSL H8-457]